MGRLGAQGVGGTIERYAATAQALVRQWELTGDEQGNRKTEEEETARTTTAQVIKDGQEAQGSHGEAISLASAMPRQARARLEASRRIAGNVARAVNIVHQYYRIAIHFKIQITPKFV